MATTIPVLVGVILLVSEHNMLEKRGGWWGLSPPDSRASVISARTFGISNLVPYTAPFLTVGSIACLMTRERAKRIASYKNKEMVEVHQATL
ncbi:uncharacterized protein N7500_009647 [Penicillium coprophilum]|uniref:uncharacterized protein n=1 Tax=Penicillium coprophilum TaxID=36646 RepID=UPI00239C02BB|nr:uncharacterized protein N7500_009647 [Penicillium coprophilum]KAJ5154208.1 hypothetical protein N7500_009647 [Penicillium coprophilum]